MCVCLCVCMSVKDLFQLGAFIFICDGCTNIYMRLCLLNVCLRVSLRRILFSVCSIYFLLTMVLEIYQRDFSNN